MASLLIGFVTGVFGIAYFVYGKKQVKFTPMLCGVALCVYPYFIDNVWASLAIGAVLLGLPFVFDY